MILQRDEGKIVLAGALTDPVDTALFIWKNASQEVSRLDLGWSQSIDLILSQWVLGPPWHLGRMHAWGVVVGAWSRDSAGLGRRVLL